MLSDTTSAKGWPSRVSHCGFSVATTNSMASATVAACEKMSQSLRIGCRMGSESGGGRPMAQRGDVESYLASLLAVVVLLG